MACIQPKTTDYLPPAYPRGRRHALVPPGCPLTADTASMQCESVTPSMLQKPPSPPSSLRSAHPSSTPRSTPSPDNPIPSIEGRHTRERSVSSNGSSQGWPSSPRRVSTPKPTGLRKSVTHHRSKRRTSPSKARAHYARDKMIKQSISHQQSLDDYISTHEPISAPLHELTSGSWDSASVSSSAFSVVGSRDDNDDDPSNLSEAPSSPIFWQLESVLSEELELRVLAKEDTPHLSQVFPGEAADIPEPPEEFAFFVAGDMEADEGDRLVRFVY